MRGIILAGGSGTRLHPVTKAQSKQLLPVFDKPMVYYPLSTLMLAGIREVLLISTPHDLPSFRRLLGDGTDLGMRIEYAEQPRPEGLAQAFVIGREFLDGHPSCLVLGDNVFYGNNFGEMVREGASTTKGGLVFGYHVRDPRRYGVVEFDDAGKAVSLEEKPEHPKSKYAVPGLYFYGPDVCDLAADLAPSARGELEITDLNRIYLERGDLHVRKLGRGIAWFDTGTHRSLLEASSFIAAVQEQQDLAVACLEEIAHDNGWITADQVRAKAESMRNSSYGEYLLRRLEEH